MSPSILVIKNFSVAPFTKYIPGQESYNASSTLSYTFAFDLRKGVLSTLQHRVWNMGQKYLGIFLSIVFSGRLWWISHPSVNISVQMKWENPNTCHHELAGRKDGMQYDKLNTDPCLSVGVLLQSLSNSLHLYCLSRLCTQLAGLLP